MDGMSRKRPRPINLELRHVVDAYHSDDEEDDIVSIVRLVLMFILHSDTADGERSCQRKAVETRIEES